MKKKIHASISETFFITHYESVRIPPDLSMFEIYMFAYKSFLHINNTEMAARRPIIMQLNQTHISFEGSYVGIDRRLQLGRQFRCILNNFIVS